VVQKRLILVQWTREVDHPEPARSASHLIRPEFTEGVDRETASGKITGPFVRANVAQQWPVSLIAEMVVHADLCVTSTFHFDPEFWSRWH